MSEQKISNDSKVVTVGVAATEYYQSIGCRKAFMSLSSSITHMTSVGDLSSLKIEVLKFLNEEYSEIAMPHCLSKFKLMVDTTSVTSEAHTKSFSRKVIRDGFVNTSKISNFVDRKEYVCFPNVD